ncbi:progestin and adipoQ receptor family member VII, a [Betta splendens]|uniref:Progestin and adipoQ receptor family member VII, a n=1 Tax=Betta splendens TaxID=158456 RepID=A0A6P7NYV2_BETSP|nr:progestin and adipoQ receptor family member VII, a [Betta splendens]
METSGRVFIGLQQVRQGPQALTPAAPSMPGTVTDTEVPCYFREHYVRTGYRPLHRSWRYYFLSLFRRHNETVNVWTHLLAFLVFVVKLKQLGETVDFVSDCHSWPLLILILSSLSYSAFSAVAHLLGGKSELCHYFFYFLDYVGVAQYQYGSAVVHYYYAADRSLRSIFMPAAAALSCLSCLGCCYGKYRNLTLPTWARKLCQVLPSALAYAWDITPVAKRLLCSAASSDPALVYHCGQVAFFLSCSFFFTFPTLERCFPGRCDFMGQSHQIFHVLLSCCTFCQIHASYLDYAGRRELYSRLHGSSEAALFVGLYAVTLVACALIVACMIRKVKQVLDSKAKSRKTS